MLFSVLYMVDEEASMFRAMILVVFTSLVLPLPASPRWAEDSEGKLITGDDGERGRVTIVDGKVYPLRSQYLNRQRDAVILARWEAVLDNRPDGRAQRIERGMGVVRFNALTVSMVDSIDEPHFSNNQKEYESFVLRDLMMGASFGVPASGVSLDWVYRDTWLAAASFGYNLAYAFGAGEDALYGGFPVMIGAGVGARMPAPVQFPVLGRHYWGAVFLVNGAIGGERQGSRLLPALAVELTKAVYADPEQPREGALPWNYPLSEWVLRMGAVFDGSGSGRGAGLFFSIGYRFQIIGPSVPGHVSKETVALYKRP
jgi:hypothetical protein